MRKIGVVLALVALASVPGRGEAQVAFGANASYGTQSDFGLGARLMIPFSRVQVGVESQLMVGGEYYFPSEPDGVDLSWVELNGNLVFPLTLGEGFRPYLGAGLNLAFRSTSLDVGGSVDESDTDVGLNIVGGWRGRRGRAAPFVEIRGVVGGTEQVVFSFGFAVGGGS